MSAPYGRGLCPVCDDEFNLTKSGTMRNHNGDVYVNGWRQICEGVGQAPSKATSLSIADAEAAQDGSASKVPTEVLRAAWDAIPNIDDVRPEGLNAALTAALPLIEQQLRKRLAYELEVFMNKPAPGCACPADSQRSCGWRDGIVDRQHASAPYVQRRVRVGFGKAGRLLRLMEERGIVERTSDGVSTFKVLVPREDKWLAMDAIRGEAS